jgi:hypothetical protein
LVLQTRGSVFEDSNFWTNQLEYLASVPGEDVKQPDTQGLSETMSLLGGVGRRDMERFSSGTELLYILSMASTKNVEAPKFFLTIAGGQVWKFCDKNDNFYVTILGVIQSHDDKWYFSSKNIVFFWFFLANLTFSIKVLTLQNY